MVDESNSSNSNIPNSDNSPPISRRKNLIPGVDDAHLALGGVGVTLLALGVVSWPSIQDWISKTFKMPLPLPPQMPNGNAAATPPQPVTVPPPPAVLPQQQQQQQQQAQEQDGRIVYPYLQRGNIAPVGQAVSVSAMETVPAPVPDQLPQPQPQPQQKRQGYYSPFGASISGEVG
jgi:hypothetical protein